jgi:hypothetical protein
MSEVSGSALCPGEDAIEGWAIQDVMVKGGKGKIREHLEICESCHDLHSKLVDFYLEVNQEAQQLIVTRKTGIAAGVSSMGVKDEPVIRVMKPLEPTMDLIKRSMPVAFSHNLVSESQVGEELERSFISTDGTVFGRFLSKGIESGFVFQLLSPDERFVSRALVHLPEDDSLFQSDDSGSTPLFDWSGTLQEIRMLEILPFTGETAYSIQNSNKVELIEESIELDAGTLGRIVVDQEESDDGESVLHFELAGLPRSNPDRRIFIALEDSRQYNIVEEAIGRDVYLYGPDLFRDFKLWVYVR